MNHPDSESDAGGAGPPNLPDEVRDVLAKLGRTVQRVSLYPPGHPALETAADEMVEYLAEATSARGPLELVVAPEKILVSDAASDPEHPQIRNLAERLHEHGLARVTFMPGLSRDEALAFLGDVGRRPGDEPGSRLGDSQGLEERWETIWAKPLRYDRLALAAQEGDEEETPSASAGDVAAEDEETAVRDRSRADHLWLGLAHAVYSPAEGEGGKEDEDGSGEGRDFAAGDSDAAGDGDGDDEVVLGPTALAAALNRHSRETMLAQAVTRQLVTIARELSATAGEGPAGGDVDGESEPRESPEARRRRQRERLQDRFGEFFKSLEPNTIRRLMREGMDRKERTELLTYGSSVLPPLAVVELVEAAAEIGEMNASPWMLRLIRKLADHATEAGGGQSAMGRKALDEQIQNLFQATENDRSRPSTYARALRDMSDEGQRAGGHEAVEVRLDPLRVAQMALEVDMLGDPGRRAVDLLLEDGRLPELLDLLSEAPEEGEVTRFLWRRLDPETSVRELLDADPPDLEGLEVLAEGMGVATAPFLLDELAVSESRSVRRKLFSLLAGMGEPLAPMLVDRLDREEPWFVLRNLLALLAEIDARPEGFSVRPWAEHHHSAVRREVYRLLLQDPETRTEGIRLALAEEDSKLASFGLAAVQTDETREILSLVVRQVKNKSLSSRIRRLGVKALETDGSDRSRTVLVDLCLHRRIWTFWRKQLAPPDAVRMAAVEALARTWPDDPEAVRVIRLARESGHDEYRQACRAGDGNESTDGAGTAGGDG